MSFLILALMFASCKDYSADPFLQSSLIIANVHWQNQGVPGIRILIVETGQSALTGPSGTAVFPVPPGHYTVRAFGINRGGPVMQSIDFAVDAPAGKTPVVDIVDCLPCV